MGLERRPGPFGSSTLSRDLFGRTPEEAPALERPAWEAVAGAEAAASVTTMPNLGFPTMGPGGGPGAVPRISVNGVGQAMRQSETPPEYADQREEARSYQLQFGHEFESAPPPLPRLSGRSDPAGEMRVERPNEMHGSSASAPIGRVAFATATAMAFTEQRGASASAFAVSSRPASWMAPSPHGNANQEAASGLRASQALAFESRCRQPSSPAPAAWSGDSRLPSGRTAAASPAGMSGIAAEASKLPLPPMCAGEPSRQAMVESLPTNLASHGYVDGGISRETLPPPPVQSMNWEATSARNVNPARSVTPTRYMDQGSLNGAYLPSAGAHVNGAYLPSAGAWYGGSGYGGSVGAPVATETAYVASGGLFSAAAGSASMPNLLEGDRQPSRGRSMTPNSQSQFAAMPQPPIWSSSPGPAMSTGLARASSYSCPVWPPPPLPPVNNELAARLEALEFQKSTSMALDGVRERRLDELRRELQIAQAAASQCKELELQLEQCNTAWKGKFDALEARWKEEEASAARRVEEAALLAEKKAQAYIGQLQADLQAVRTEGDRGLEDVERRGQEEMARLQRELQAAQDAEQRALEDTRRRDQDILKLRDDLERQQDGTQQSAEQLRKLEQRARDMEEELNRERAHLRQRGVDDDDRKRAYEVALDKIKIDSEELRAKLEVVTKQRDQLEGDMEHLKLANRQREEQCKELRASITEEKRHIRMLQAELDTRKAEVANMAARASLQSGGERRVSTTSITGAGGETRRVSTTSITGGDQRMSLSGEQRTSPRGEASFQSGGQGRRVSTTSSGGGDQRMSLGGEQWTSPRGSVGSGRGGFQSERRISQDFELAPRRSGLNVVERTSIMESSSEAFSNGLDQFDGGSLRLGAARSTVTEMIDVDLTNEDEGVSVNGASVYTSRRSSPGGIISVSIEEDDDFEFST